MYKTTVATALLLCSTSALSAESVELNKSLPIKNAELLYIDVPVGQLEIETYQGDSIVLYIEVAESKTNWFKSVDLDDAHLRQKRDNNRLKLSVNLENTTQHWKVKVPENIDLNLSIGVGEADLSGIGASLKMDVGVGSAQVVLSHDDYQSINLDAGVGDASLEDFNGVNTTRAVVSEEVDWAGKGQHEINIDVGVGDVEVRVK